MERRDWTLLALAVAPGNTLQPIQLQKSLFLVGENLPKEVGKKFYNFTPYNYGPFNSQIYDDADYLVAKNEVEIIGGWGNPWREYKITDSGKEKAVELRSEVSPVAIDYLESVIVWMKKLSFRSLIRAIYKEYPEYSRNSVFGG